MRSHIWCRWHIWGSGHSNSIGGEVVSTTAFVLSAQQNSSFKAVFIRLTSGNSEAQKSTALRDASRDVTSPLRYVASEIDFKMIPGDPLAYWVSSALRAIFSSAPDFDSVLEAREGLTTGKNEDYVRYNFEVSRCKVFRNAKTKSSFKNNFVCHDALLCLCCKVDEDPIDFPGLLCCASKAPLRRAEQCLGRTGFCVTSVAVQTELRATLF